MALRTPHKTHRLKGATLIESLTALAILTSVMGAAFTLYENTVSRQQQVMKVRARLVQLNAESAFQNISVLHDLSDDFVTASIEEQPYHGQNDVRQLVLTVTGKQGKTVLRKNYLLYTPEGK